MRVCKPLQNFVMWSWY